MCLILVKTFAKTFRGNFPRVLRAERYVQVVGLIPDVKSGNVIRFWIFHHRAVDRQHSVCVIDIARYRCLHYLIT